jgi:hypothetical protein
MDKNLELALEELEASELKKLKQRIAKRKKVFQRFEEAYNTLKAHLPNATFKEIRYAKEYKGNLIMEFVDPRFPEKKIRITERCTTEHIYLDVIGKKDGQRCFDYCSSFDLGNGDLVSEVEKAFYHFT